MSAAPWLPAVLARRFEAVVFGWEGTAVADPSTDPGSLRALVTALCAYGLDLYVVTAADLDRVDGRLRARPAGPGRLYLCVNHGSEVFRAGPEGVELVHRRTPTQAEDAGLDRAAQVTVAALAGRGLRATVVALFNRRRVQLVPGSGRAGLHETVDLTADAARRAGLTDPRVTSDGTYVEIGLTDQADAVRWALADLHRRVGGVGLPLLFGTTSSP
jgi:hypothetical protein